MNTNVKSYVLKEYHLRVKDRPNNERPHEKLQHYGPQELSSQELLAAILYTGTRNMDVLEMASRLLDEYGDNYIIHETDPKKIRDVYGIPLQKATQAIAAFALGKRLFYRSKRPSVTIRNAKDAYRHLSHIGHYDKEHLRGLYVNSRFKLVHEEAISIGTITESIVHPREVFKPAIEHGAVAVILAHNHPSGSLEPSASDKEMTERIVEAGNMLGIQVIDHLIIAGEKFNSIINE